MKRVLRILGLLLAAGLTWLLAVWPPPSWYRSHWPRETAFMAMRRSQGHPPRVYRPVPLDSIAPVMAQAVVIGEDNNFETHAGIDYLALAHAIGYRRPSLSLRNPRDRAELAEVLPGAWRHRDKLRGASTITQQLAKNLYLSSSRNPLRKLKEAVIAWRLEAALDKNRIMALYLNVAELGDGVWGVEAASETYFHRTAKGLGSEEAAALAGSLPFPLSSNPAHRPGRMRWRQNLIMRRLRGEWVEVPPVEEEEPPAAELVPVDSVPLPDTLLPGIDSTATPAVDSVPSPDTMPPDTASGDSS
jgi:monofunctional glycosyltransferase